MNKKVNLVLNIIELLFVILVGIAFILSLSIELSLDLTSNISDIELFKDIILYSSLAFIFIIVSIEVFLFFNYKLRFKFSYIGFLILDLFVALYINNIYTFSGIFVILGFCLIKFILRLCLINKLYIPDEFYRYLDLYHIPYKKTTKKKSASKKNASSKKVSTVKTTKNKKETTSVSNKKKKAVVA